MKANLLAAVGAAGLLMAAASAAQAAAAAPAASPVTALTAPTPQPPGPPTALKPGKRVNRVIEMWLKGQPVYYTQVDTVGYEEGKKLAGTKADYISYNMEHAPLDFTKLRDFMQGLKDGGMTRTGHVTPAVIVVLPIAGTADALRANQWMIQQALAQGVHGILLCNAESAEAVQLMVQAARYPFAPAVPGIAQGTRGNGSQGQAAPMWGMSAADYFKSADVWPLNPNGEIILGLKIENPRAVTNMASTLGVPGVAFAEWGPGDNGFHVLGVPGSGSQNDPRMVAIRANVLKEAKARNIKFLNACNEETVIQQIQDGAMICTGGDTPAADKGRAFTKRTDPS
jgi:4-hydroxy-2-oxoheptanedioate aldolase